MKDSLKAGLIFGVLGFAVVFVFYRFGVKSSGFRLLTFTNGLAGFICGGFFWAVLVAWQKSGALWAGALAGALTGLCAHPLAWFFTVFYKFGFGAPVAAGQPPVDFVTAIQGTWLLGAPAISLAAWFAVPLCAIMGGVLRRYTVHDAD